MTRAPERQTDLDEDRLRHLLTVADRPPPAPGDPAALAGRVRAAARRRRRRARAAVAAVAAATLIAAAWLGVAGTRQVAPAVARRDDSRPTHVAVPRQARDQTTTDARRAADPDDGAARRIADQERLVAALLAGERRRELTARLAAAPDAPTEVDGRRAEAAGIGLGYARSIGRRDPASARRQYRRVIDLYPGSRVAVAAAGELNELDPPEGATP